ncbi:MAG: transporter family protein [Betaproteobacteria bacterium]|nr:transporter family protein [Betaproteobacteria bacterium]
MAEPMLQLRDLVFEGRGHRAIDGVTLALDAGRTAILGANGAGKSVLLRLMHGLLMPSSGEVQWTGIDGRAPRLAMVFQKPVLLRRSALDNVIYGLQLSPAQRAEPAARLRERALAALARVDLAHLAQRPGRVLSGGEQQRVALARAWALEPDVLLLDEPTASLDPAAMRAVEAVILEIAAGGTSIVMTTHHRGLARRFADSVVFLDAGRVAEHTPVNEFFAQPRSGGGHAYLEGEIA